MLVEVVTQGLLIVVAIVVFIEGPTWLLLVMSVSLGATYIVERIRSYRKIAGLARELGAGARGDGSR